MSQRVEILWSRWEKERGDYVERWLCGVLIQRHSDGRCYVQTECGLVAQDAAPECVREVVA